MEKSIITAKAPTIEEDDNNVQWWTSLLLATNCNEEFTDGSTSSVQNLLNDEETLLPEIFKGGSGTIGTIIGWSDDFSVDEDIDLWGLRLPHYYILFIISYEMHM